MKALITIRRLAWDEKIKKGDFHALSDTPNAIYPLTGTQAIGKTVTQWRRETKTSDREFFRIDQPRATAAIVQLDK